MRRIASEGGCVFLGAFVIYLIVALLLDFKYHSFPGDAVSRMGNGFYILYSRDPHLAAVGFVWTPLTSLCDLIFLLGNHIWPALAHNDMAGSLTSALTMAGAAYQLLAALREWGLNRISRLVLAAFFILNPMILYYGGNGMSEGIYLFTLTAATRYLLRWVRTDDLRSLAYGAVALGFSYLTRNEAFGAIAAGTLCVGLVSYWRRSQQQRKGLATATADAAIFAVPGFVAAVGWAIASYVITGSFFGQLSSLYGNSAQEKFIHHKPFHGRVIYEIHAITSLWPLLPVILVAAAVVALRRRDPSALAPLTVLGGALGFDLLIYLDNSIQPYYRYFIVTIPLGIFLVAAVIAPNSSFHANKGQRPIHPSSSSIRGSTLRSIGQIALILAALIPATATTAGAMFNSAIAPEESEDLAFIFKSHLNAADSAFAHRYATILGIGTYLANLGLPNGDIIIDNSTNCVPEVLTTVSQPKLFVIPNDRDFQRTLADPIQFHAHYIVEPNPAEIPVSAPNLEFSALWRTGAGFAEQIHQFPATGTCPEFRLFKVLRHPSQAI
jgi:hypothetical protein